MNALDQVSWGFQRAAEFQARCEANKLRSIAVNATELTVDDLSMLIPHGTSLKELTLAYEPAIRLKERRQSRWCNE